MVKILLRLPDELAKELDSLADQHFRSRNSELIMGLQEYVQRSKQQRERKRTVKGVQYATATVR